MINSINVKNHANQIVADLSIVCQNYEELNHIIKYLSTLSMQSDNITGTFSALTLTYAEGVDKTKYYFDPEPAKPAITPLVNDNYNPNSPANPLVKIYAVKSENIIGNSGVQSVESPKQESKVEIPIIDPISSLELE